MKRYTPFIISLLVALSPAVAGTSALDDWGRFSRTTGSRELINWLKINARLILEGKGPDSAMPAAVPVLSGRAGMFITLVKKGKVRGCYGSFYHAPGSDSAIFLRYLHGALYLDPRYRPISPAELEATEIIITITSYPEPVDDPNNIDIARYGVFIETGGAGGTVVVPAEFRTLAGITAISEEKECRYSRFEAVTIR